MDLPQDEPRNTAPVWAITFADMMTLLLCFFVLVLAFSALEIDRFKVLARSMRDAFGGPTQVAAEGPVGALEYPDYTRARLLEHVELLRRRLPDPSLVQASLEDDGVRVRLSEKFAFARGSAVLEPDVHAMLDGLARLIADSGKEAVVEGHTDSLPIGSATFPSNWELSAARAGAVVRYLVAHGVPGNRIEAVGRADTRPLADNRTEDGMRRNRRVEILIRTAAS
ncbi:MAG: flagellar motor protein MotB [Acidobacteria bacterium]|nr:flagellar motor protein MotB [Acidobacteriota bacterium]